ncbi:MAG TPA: ubiquinol-cytochrome c reductase cytochrome b subunit [Acidimicrobiales bacterium]|nr:ubiquinol-cytochrome c reductase cytochrome b subunit [Acidimicrobiales bacterium]
MSATKQRLAAEKRMKVERMALDQVDDRINSSSFVQKALDHIFPDHWAFMVGEIAMYCFVVLLVTGTYLALYYTPSSADVVYHPTPGHGYMPLAGQHMSEAYFSTLNLSFDVRAGLVVRQIHHWAAVVFMAAIAFHLCRVFFTGAFRKPRETNYVIGLTLLLVVMLEGFSGYSLPDDLLSGTGLRVVFSIVESIPFIGTWLAFDLWGSGFPGSSLIPRLFVVHEFLFPLLIIGLLSAHLALIWRQGHTDFPAPGKTETNIRGSRVWPQYALKSGALLLFVFGVLALLGGLIQINPIWIYGAYNPYAVSAGSQPDWYVGWLDGAVRLWPHWEFRSFGHEIANPFFPGVLIPGLLFTVMYAWPAIDKRIYRDDAYHNLLDRPRDKPFRTAVGVAAITFFTICTLASATDLLGNDTHIAFERLIEILQIGVFVAPVLAGAIAYKACVALQRTGNHVIMQPVGGILIRTADGAYHTLGDEHHGHGEIHDHVDGNGGGNGRGDGNGGGNGHDDAELEEPVVGGKPQAPGDPNLG